MFCVRVACKDTKMNKSVLVIISFVWLVTAAPTPLGSNGIITVPSAYLYKDGQIHIGFKYESETYPFYRSRFNQMEEKGIIAGFSFLPFIELSLRYGLDPHADRLANIRVQVLKESRFRPAITVGFRDALTILRGINDTPNKGTAKTSYYNSVYLVTGKTVQYKLRSFPQKVSLHLGGGYSDFDNSRYQHLHGIFGGLEYQFHESIPLVLKADYDTKEFRFGITAYFKEYMYCTFSSLKGKDFAFVVTGGMNLQGVGK